MCALLQGTEKTVFAKVTYAELKKLVVDRVASCAYWSQKAPEPAPPAPAAVVEEKQPEPEPKQQQQQLIEEQPRQHSISAGSDHGPAESAGFVVVSQHDVPSAQMQQLAINPQQSRTFFTTLNPSDTAGHYNDFLAGKASGDVNFLQDDEIAPPQQALTAPRCVQAPRPAPSRRRARTTAPAAASRVPQGRRPWQSPAGWQQTTTSVQQQRC